MPLKRILIWSSFTIKIIIFFLIIIFFSTTNLRIQSSHIKSDSIIKNQSWENKTKNNKISTEKIVSGLPIWLIIPKINVDAPIKYVGLTAQWNMDAPKGPDIVTWFKLWPKPWEIGSAVIAGHYGKWKNGKISVFKNLNKLVKGNKIYIKNDKWITISFVVTKTKQYKRNADAWEVFTSDDGKSHLNLITCIYDKISKTYPKRLVVFTDKE